MRNLRPAATGLMVIVIFLNVFAKLSVSGVEPEPETTACNDAILVASAEPTSAAQGAELDSAISQSTAPIEAADLAGQGMLLQPEQAEFSPGFSATHVTLSGPDTTISWDDHAAVRQKLDLPLLYLHRQRESTVEPERTLAIQIAGLSAGAKIQIKVQSRHVDVSTGDYHCAVKNFALPERECTAENPCTMRWIFDAVEMHSDFYDLRVTDAAGNLLWDETRWPEFVLLDTWDVAVGEYTVRVTYATLFPFAKGLNDRLNKLPPGAVTDFIAYQFVPIIVDTWNTQFDTWGFGHPIHPDWDPDKVVEVFVTDPPYALFGGTGTYHTSVFKDGRPYPQRRLWWHAANDSFQAYETLEDAYRAVFAHEFFHLMQWNIILSAGCSTNRWTNVLIEGQGKFAPSVMHPETEIGSQRADGLDSEYGGAANRFLALRLNSSYKDLEVDPTDKYDAALYWRFLYEQFDDTGVIRVALEEMACHYDPDIVAGIGGVMDRTFQRLDGPFRTFEESLIAFARANYALRLENGRCEAADLAACEGLYQGPKGMYVDPPLEAALLHDGSPLTYEGAIPSSFGMDFIEVALDPALQGRPLTLKFRGEGSVARFNVEVWLLGPGLEKPRAVTLQPETVPQNQDGAHVYMLPSLDITTYDRLALIITRLDPDEATDPTGRYSITL